MDQAFEVLANISRKHILWKRTNATRKKRNARKYRFVTSHEPAFPDIKKILLKHHTSYWMTMNLRRYSLMGQKTFKFQREERPKTLKNCLLYLK